MLPVVEELPPFPTCAASSGDGPQPTVERNAIGDRLSVLICCRTVKLDMGVVSACRQGFNKVIAMMQRVSVLACIGAGINLWRHLALHLCS